jgi:hypothetical protein
MSKHYLVQVGCHTIFLDRIDGYGRIAPFMGGGESERWYFPVYLMNGETLLVKGTEKQVDEEQGMLLERLESISDPEPEVDESHPQGQSG